MQHSICFISDWTYKTLYEAGYSSWLKATLVLLCWVGVPSLNEHIFKRLAFWCVIHCYISIWMCKSTELKVPKLCNWVYGVDCNPSVICLLALNQMQLIASDSMSTVTVKCQSQVCLPKLLPCLLNNLFLALPSLLFICASFLCVIYFPHHINSHTNTHWWGDLSEHHCADIWSWLRLKACDQQMCLILRMSDRRSEVCIWLFTPTALNLRH